MEDAVRSERPTDPQDSELAGHGDHQGGHGKHPDAQDSGPDGQSRAPRAEVSAGEHPPAGHPHLHHQLAAIEQRLSSLVTTLEQTGQATVHGLEHETARLVPAWRRATAGELRWPVSLVMTVMIGLQLAVPRRLSPTGHWFLPGLEAVLLAVVIAFDPARVGGRSPAIRGVSLTLIATATLANAYSAVNLIVDLVEGAVDNAPSLLLTGGNIWFTNIIIFGVWYWELDRGGPAARALAVRGRPSFLFPEMTMPDLAEPDWEPQFVDYLYLAYTNATAFSPTDTLPFSRWARVMMMGQSAISLATGALVIARAVNILK